MDKRIEYIVNEEKTILSDTIKYVENEAKTKQCLYVSTYNCIKSTAYADMMATKEQWGKADGKNFVLGYHVIQSFAPGEITPQDAHACGMELAKRLFSDRYEVVIATHLDRKHLHNHIIFNSVSFVDGKMYRNNFKDLFGDIRETSDKICREHSLSVITSEEKGKHYAEWQAEKEKKPTIRSMIRQDIDEIIAHSFTFSTFLAQLEQYGYVVKYGERVKYMAVKPKEGERFIRLKSLGENYTEEAIRKRLEKIRNDEWLGKNDKKQYLVPRKYRVKKGMSIPRKRKRLKGFQALYFRYLYMLGKVKRRRLPNRAAFLLRDDLIRFDRYVEQFCFLHENHISNSEQLNGYEKAVARELQIHKENRHGLYAERRKCNDDNQKESITKQIKEHTEKMRSCRKSLRLCQLVAENSKKINKNMEDVRKTETEKNHSERKEENYEYPKRSR